MANRFSCENWSSRSLVLCLCWPHSSTSVRNQICPPSAFPAPFRVAAFDTFILFCLSQSSFFSSIMHTKVASTRLRSKLFGYLCQNGMSCYRGHYPSSLMHLPCFLPLAVLPDLWINVVCSLSQTQPHVLQYSIRVRLPAPLQQVLHRHFLVFPGSFIRWPLRLLFYKVSLPLSFR